MAVKNNVLSMLQRFDPFKHRLVTRNDTGELTLVNTKKWYVNDPAIQRLYNFDQSEVAERVRVFFQENKDAIKLEIVENLGKKFKRILRNSIGKKNHSDVIEGLQMLIATLVASKKRELIAKKALIELKDLEDSIIRAKDEMRDPYNSI